MKNLWIFGDSFSTNFSIDSNNQIDKNHIWPQLLADKLNLQLLNHSHIGISNQGLLQMIYRNLDSNEGDTIIFGLTFFNRIYDFYKNRGIDILHSSYDELLDIGIEDYVIDFHKKRLNDIDGYHASVGQQLEQYHFLFKMLKKNNITFYFWCLDKIKVDFYFKLINDFEDNFIRTPNLDEAWFNSYILKKEEWSLSNDDFHFSKTGHQEFYEYLYNTIEWKSTKK